VSGLLQLLYRRWQGAHLFVIDSHIPSCLHTLAEPLKALGQLLVKPGLVRPLLDASLQERHDLTVLLFCLESFDPGQGYTQSLRPTFPGRLGLGKRIIQSTLLDGQRNAEASDLG